MTLLILFITLFAGMLILYHHLVYPVLLKLLAKWRVRNELSEPSREPECTSFPFITVVVPCYNEAAVIAEKMRNFTFLDYPADRFCVRFINDGSTDQTQSIFQKTILEPGFTELNITMIQHRDNRGKVARINEALATIEDGLVVLSDTSALISMDAFQIIAQRFQNPKVGVVAGTYQILVPGSRGESAYWQYQTKIKAMESALGSAIGAHGALYGFRRALFEPLPVDTINDDFILPMEIVKKGYQCEYVNDIVAVELEQASMQLDQRRRVRISMGNMQQAIRLKGLLNPSLGGVAFNFASGKFLRAWMPLILLLFFSGTLVLSAQSGFFASLTLLQVFAYSLAALKQFLPNLKWPKPIQLLHYLVSGHVSNGIGSLYYFCNRKSGAPWSRVKASSGAQHYIPVSILFSKRLVDFCLASLGVLITLPVWLLIGLAIKLESRGPVFFRQMRVGRILPDRAELFMMIKFRTMIQDAEKETGAVWAQDRDPRITKVGWFLRKTRLDELPQLLNVIKGEMSLIGPRPERPGIGGQLDAAIPYYAERTCFVSPGITGFAQVHQGYDTCLDDVKSKLLYDHAYAIALSRFRAWLLMDLMVIYKTLLVMVLGKGR